MNAIKFERTVDEPTAQVLPELRRFMGKRVELIVFETPANARPTIDASTALLAAIGLVKGQPADAVEDERALYDG